MKFAICNETFQGWPLEKGLRFAAQCGYKGIEIAPFTIANYVTEITPQARAEIRRLAEALDLEVVGLHWLLARTEGFHLTSPEPEIRRRTSEYITELARCCADIGGRILVFGSPQQRNLLPDVSRQQGIDYAAEVFERATAVLEQTGVVLALEPLGPHETNFLVTTADAVELIDRIGSPYVRLHLDCKAMATEIASIPDLLRLHRQILAHFHANDPNRQGPGFGSLDFHPIFETLGQIDYRGWVSVEVFDYTPGIEKLREKALNTWRSVCYI